jgi:hypothetical protein
MGRLRSRKAVFKSNAFVRHIAQKRSRCHSVYLDRFGDESLGDPLIVISSLLDRNPSPGMSFVDLNHVCTIFFTADFDNASEDFVSSDHIGSDDAISDSSSVVSQSSQDLTASIISISYAFQ